MERYEFKSWKSLAIMVGICSIFLILVIQAFQYIPETSDGNNLIEEPVEEVVVSENVRSGESEDTSVSTPDKANIEEVVYDHNSDDKVGYSYKSPRIVSRDRELDKYTNDIISDDSIGHVNPKDNFELVEEPKLLEPIRTPEEEKVETFYKMMREAEDFKNKLDYQNALKVYLSLYKMESSKTDRLMILDSIANIYANMKEYAKAIPFAIESYKLEPTLNREIFATKLYYKNGEVDKATKRINLIMQREFEMDN